MSREKEKFVFSAKIAANLDAIKIAENEMLAILRRLNRNEGAIDDFFLCVHEHILNVAEHGLGFNPDKHIRVIIKRVGQSRLVAKIIDDGPFFDYRSLNDGINAIHLGYRVLRRMASSIKAVRINGKNTFTIVKIIP